MKKNVIHIIVDAYCYENLHRNVGGREVTPFLNALRKESVSFERMFSQAPYTEASQITLLSGENTLDHGGYLFGNGTVEKTMFSRYREAGYRTVFTYSPYVYSKAYLRDADIYYYTRFFSIEPLFLYRLQYYYDIQKRRTLTRDEMTVCVILLQEALETWQAQCRSILTNGDEIALIRDWVKDIAVVRETAAVLEAERQKLDTAPEDYVREVFAQWQEHILRKLNQRYNERSEIKLRKQCIEAFQPAMEAYQKTYSRVLKKHPLDLEYVAGMVFRNKNGMDDAKNTFAAYRKHWSSTELRDYFTSVDERAKTEASMNRAFEVFEKTLVRLDENNENFYAYIHVQDFHLPSVFHSLDTEDFAMVQDEFQIAFDLLDGMDDRYRGNIIADLSARYCDRKIELFYQKMKALLRHDVVFTVTADHGFPCYETPPRPMVYNQTYVEAFHIPCIVHDGTHTGRYSGIYSNMDAMHVEMQCAGVEPEHKIPERQYVLCEYGGPGCPDIGIKPIWYTYIDEQWRISAECPLTKPFSMDCVKAVFDIQKDPWERRDLLKSKGGSAPVRQRCEVIRKRHDELRERFAGDRFLADQLRNLK